MSVTTLVGWWALFAGVIFGATANKTNFCTMGAISDMVFMEDYGRMRAWVLAIAVAIIGTTALHSNGLIDVNDAFYRTANLGWFGAILGGLMFGYGMTMAGGCGNKTLVRIGGGNLKSIYVFLVMGVFAVMTMRGLIGMGRVEVEAVVNLDLAKSGITSQGVDAIIASVLGMSEDVVRWVVVAVLCGGALVWCFKDHEFRSLSGNMIGGIIIGLLIPFGWFITGVIGNDDFDPVPMMSFTFTGPSGDSIQYMMLFSAMTINFGIAAVGGVILGSFLVAMATKSFSFEGFGDVSDMMRHTFGAMLMGVGGVVAMGCTIGQGITGMSTLALSSFLALGSIIVGGILGMKYMEEGTFFGALKAMVPGRA